jgi:hypothetical protein
MRTKSLFFALSVSLLLLGSVGSAVGQVIVRGGYYGPPRRYHAPRYYYGPRYYAAPPVVYAPLYGPPPPPVVVVPAYPRGYYYGNGYRGYGRGPGGYRGGHGRRW